MDKFGDILKRHRGKIALVALAAGGIALAPKAPEAWDNLNNWAHPDSAVVAGVPGQVESHSTTRTCAAYIKSICSSYQTNYFLGIEQCPQDVKAAQAGQQTTSFNPAVGQRYAECVFDWVEVGADLYSAYPDGSTITFNGPVGGTLHSD